MMRNKLLRTLLGIVLGGLGGVSLCISVLPTVLQMTGAGDQMALSYHLAPYIVHTALIWAAGGWAVTRSGSPLAGGLTMAVVGLVTGMLLVVLGLDAEAKLLAGGACGGVVYGFLGGLILGRITEAPAPEGEDTP